MMIPLSSYLKTFGWAETSCKSQEKWLTDNQLPSLLDTHANLQKCLRIMKSTFWKAWGFLSLSNGFKIEQVTQGTQNI